MEVTDTGDIDVVAHHERTRTTYIADVKCTNKKYGFAEFNVLQQRIKNVPYSGQMLLFVFSQSGFAPDFLKYAKEKKITLIDLEQVSSLFDRV